MAHARQALVGLVPNGQALEIRRKVHSLQTLVDPSPKCRAAHALKALVVTPPKRQAIEFHREGAHPASFGCTPSQWSSTGDSLEGSLPAGSG